MANAEFENLKASMKTAIWDKEQTIIGKGIYTPNQLKSAIAEIESLEKQLEHVQILREALSGLCDSQLTSRDREDAIARGFAALEATKPES